MTALRTAILVAGMVLVVAACTPKQEMKCSAGSITFTGPDGKTVKVCADEGQQPQK